MAILEKRNTSYSLLKEKQRAKLCFQAFGTTCNLDLPYSKNFNVDFICKEVVSWVNHFQQRYSRYLENSWVSEVNRAAGKEMVALTKEDYEILQAATFAFFLSKHAIDPSCLPLTKIWQNATVSKVLPEEKKVLQARDLVNWNYVEYTPNEIFLPKAGMGLDFGGFGKELAIDKITGLLKSHGVENFLINFGGDIFAAGYADHGEDWKVGIENPNQEAKPAYVIKLKDHALASSGNYRKFFDVGDKRYGHTLDPRTGYPTIHSQLSASIVNPSCMKAGILSTSCLLNGQEKGLQMIEAEWGTEGCIQSLDSCSTSNRFYDYILYEDSI